MPRTVAAMSAIVVQQPDAVGREPANLLEQIAAEPALLQLVVLVLLGIVLWVLLNRMAHAVREARSRAATRDFLVGVEQVLHGDPTRAAKRLESVLSEDPENTTARLFYALALAELGKPGEAHKHHVQLARGFGVASLRNESAMAESLLDSGRAGEAVDVVVALAARHPQDLDVARLELRSQLAAGNQREAGEAALRLARRLPVGAERDRVQDEGARAFAMAAKVRIARGDHGAARELLELAARCRDHLPETRRTALLLDYAEGGEASVERLLASPSGDEPESCETRPAVIEPTRSIGAVAILGRLSPAGAYVCGACDAPSTEPLTTCPHCGATGRVRATEPELVAEVDSPVHVIDAIEENRAHVQRLLRRLGDRDPEVEAELLAIGEGAVEETLARAVEAGPDDTVWLPLLQRMGPSIVPALFDAYRRRKDDWLTRFGELIGRRSASAVVGRIVQSFGREALPQFRELLDAADRELRSVIIDYYIGLADQAEFQRILERFPPVEIVRRLERAPGDVLRRFVATVEPGSFQAQVLLVEPAFTRDVDVFLSIDADSKGAAEEVLGRRGFSRSLVRVLIENLTDPARGAVAERLLDGFGERGA
ncbi:MAG: tetratricopeptide repeat protein, partial [Planctomycetes bacterium]|nr:tetratricopeptide repeat protein [Planctomycetota bacterium]